MPINGVCRPRVPIIGLKVCPQGEFPVDGVCRPRPIGPLRGPKTCPGNEVLIDGNCRPKLVVTPTGPKTCPGNEVLIGDVCRPRIVNQPQVTIITCQAGTIKRGNSCVPIPPRRTPTVQNTVVHPPVKIRTPIRNTTPTKVIKVQQFHPPQRTVTPHPAAPACKLVRGKCVR